jgi:release factor glutamine methyltransferase
MYIRQALQLARQSLAETSPTADLDAQVLLCHVLQCNSAHLIAWPEKRLDEAQQRHFLQFIEQRRQGYPVAHLTGQREFWSMDFMVDESTLIPRPETETLIEYVLENHSHHSSLKLLDMGTGTGAIAIVLAKENPGWQVHACDISPQAIQLAKRNRDKHEINNLTLLKSDWFSDIDGTDYDIIISNPPYIDADDPHLNQGDVRFEPASALISDNQGMKDIEHICSQAKGHLNNAGWLIVEHGYDQAEKVADCFAKNGYSEITQKKDLSSHIRMTAGRR